MKNIVLIDNCLDCPKHENGIVSAYDCKSENIFCCYCKMIDNPKHDWGYLPYQIVAKGGFDIRMQTSIPDWCPLLSAQGEMRQELLEEMSKGKDVEERECQVGEMSRKRDVEEDLKEILENNKTE